MVNNEGISTTNATFRVAYKKYIGWAILLNILSAVFNVFSFTFLIPILSILFKTEGADKVYHFMEWGSGDLADVAKNNLHISNDSG